VANIFPSAYQSIVATRELKSVVNAVTTSVIFAPILSQLINLVKSCIALFIVSPKNFPSPSQSPALNSSFSLFAKSPTRLDMAPF